MVSTKFYLDTRASGDREAPLKIAITKKGRTAYFNTGHRILPEHWDAEHQKVIKHPARTTLNTSLLELMVTVREKIQKMVLSGEAALMNSTMIKDRLYLDFYGSKQITLKEYWDVWIKTKNETSALTYKTAFSRASKFCESRNTSIERYSIATITAKWCEEFDKWLLERMSMNSRNATIAPWKGMFNQAVKDGLVNSNPFASITQTYVVTRKRSLDTEQFKNLIRYKPENSNEALAMDAILASFFMRAANMADIYKLTDDNVFNGRIEYDRAKTGKHYSVKIEPELQEVIDRRRKGKKLFYGKDRTKNATASSVNDSLKKIAEKLGLPMITFYWIRHSFASIAMELEIPVDIIGAMLGHSTGARVTLGYIDIKSRQVDEAARKVYDFVLSEKE